MTNWEGSKRWKNENLFESVSLYNVARLDRSRDFDYFLDYALGLVFRNGGQDLQRIQKGEVRWEGSQGKPGRSARS